MVILGIQIIRVRMEMGEVKWQLKCYKWYFLAFPPFHLPPAITTIYCYVLFFIILFERSQPADLISVIK